ncbi:hypothetical protein O3G_MSEX015509 [Manduca sexta]|uniref:Uncharacterized protein n=1 Tax=Manduca sexta TaxID=7130 RepID=A0A921ZX43_MANSE|nr:hypothetical protein O3G_MSEX015509 [Manduca sexta]
MAVESNDAIRVLATVSPVALMKVMKNDVELEVRILNYNIIKDNNKGFLFFAFQFWWLIFLLKSYYKSFLHLGLEFLFKFYGTNFELYPIQNRIIKISLVCKKLCVT